MTTPASEAFKFLTHHPITPVKIHAAPTLKAAGRIVKAANVATKVVCTAVHFRTGIPTKICQAGALALISAGVPAAEITVEKLTEYIKTHMSELKKFKEWMSRPFDHEVETMSKGKKGKNSSQIVSGGRSGLGGVSYAPVAISNNINRRSKPRTRVRGDAVIISHSEMLGGILSGTPTANVTAFRCFGMRANPGIANVFPWLSSVAVNYEKYRFRRLSFTIIPLVSTGFNGRIGVGFDFDSSDSPPGNRQEFYALTTHAENMPWQAAKINVRCDNTYRFTGTHVAADNKLIDQGQVILMSDSISNGGTISAALPLYDLIVDYEVELVEAQQALFSSQLFQNTALTNGVTLGVGTDTTNIVGPNVVTSVVVTSNTVLTLNLPAGNYFVSIIAAWSSGAATVAVATVSLNTTLRFNTSTGTSFVAVTGTISSTNDSVVTFTTSGVGWATSLTKFDLVVSRVPSALASGFVP